MRTRRTVFGIKLENERNSQLINATVVRKKAVSAMLSNRIGQGSRTQTMASISIYDSALGLSSCFLLFRFVLRLSSG